jgi:hypothetical protein
MSIQAIPLGLSCFHRKGSYDARAGLLDRRSTKVVDSEYFRLPHDQETVSLCLSSKFQVFGLARQAWLRRSEQSPNRDTLEVASTFGRTSLRFLSQARPLGSFGRDGMGKDQSIPQNRTFRIGPNVLVTLGPSSSYYNGSIVLLESYKSLGLYVCLVLFPSNQRDGDHYFRHRRSLGASWSNCSFSPLLFSSSLRSSAMHKVRFLREDSLSIDS